MYEIGELIKQTAVKAMDAQKPLDAVFGTVTQTEPLEIRLSQKLTLGEANLVVPSEVTTRTANISGELSGKLSGSMSGEIAIDFGDYTRTGSFTDAYFSGTCSGTFNGTATLTDGLKQGERVLLLRMSGGQRYIVIGRCGEK